MGGINSVQMKPTSTAVEEIITKCETLANKIVTGGSLSDGQKMLLEVARTSAPNDTQKQIAIIKTYLSNLSSWETIGVFNSLPSEDTNTFIIPEGTIFWKSSNINANQYKPKPNISKEWEGNINSGIWGSSLEMAFAFTRTAKNFGVKYENLAAFVLPRDIRLFRIENKKSVLALMEKIKKLDIAELEKTKMISALSLISGYSDKWFTGLRQLKAEWAKNDVFTNLKNLFFITPRSIIGQRLSLAAEDRHVMNFIDLYRKELGVDGWIEQAGILSEAEMALSNSVLVTESNTFDVSEIGVEPARQFLRSKSHFGFDYSYVYTIKNNLRRRLPEYMIFLGAVAATQAWWLQKSRQMYKEVQSSWEKRKEFCDSDATGVPTADFLLATLVASKYMVPAHVLFDPESGELRNMEIICSEKFDRLPHRELIEAGFLMVFLSLIGNLSPIGLYALYQRSQHPWRNMQESIKKAPIALKDLTKFQIILLGQFFGPNYETELLALPVPALRSIIIKKFPLVRAFVFIDANSGEVRTEPAEIIAKLMT